MAGMPFGIQRRLPCDHADFTKRHHAGTGTVQPLPSHVLQQEYELVKNAFYTEPHDQSSWLYLRWLIGNSLAGWEKAKDSPEEAAARQVHCFSLCMQICSCPSLSVASNSTQAHLVETVHSMLGHAGLLLALLGKCTASRVHAVQ